MVTFIEHPSFTRFIEEWLTDREYREFQQWLATNPEAGDVIPGLGGLRKVRLALPQRGKRGGARVLYLLLLRAETIYFVYAYSKGDIGDLPPDMKRAMRRLVDDIKRELSP
jgi:hypothetical protein